MIKLSVNEIKWSSLLVRTRALILYISIWIFDFGPVKLPGLSRNGPLVSSSESRGRWVWSRKFSRTLRSGASPWDATRIEQVPRLLRMLVCVLGTKIFLCPIRDQRASISLRSWSTSYTKKLTCKLHCFSYARVKLSPLLDVWLAQESFLREISPQSLLFKFHSIVLCHWGEKLNNNFTNFKGRKIYPELVPDKYICRGGVNNHASDFTRTSLDVLRCLRICILK